MLKKVFWHADVLQDEDLFQNFFFFLSSMLDQDIFRATDRKRYIEYVNRMHLKYTGDLQTSAID
jgi:hypothetical protein